MSFKIKFLNHWRNHALFYQLALILGGMVIVIGGFFYTVKFLQRTGETGYVVQEALTEEEILAYSTRPEDQLFDQPINGERLRLQEVIRRALKAHGGVQRLTDIQTLRRSGTTTVFQEDGSSNKLDSTVIFRSPDKIRYTYETPDYVMTAGSNGEDIWRRIEPQRGEAKYDRLTALDGALIEIDLMTLQPFSDRHWREGELILLPSSPGDSDAPYVIERRYEQILDTFTIDAGHFLCIRREVTGLTESHEGPAVVTIEYSDYRYVNEVAMPFQVITYVEGEKSNTLEVAETVLNPGVLSYVFDPPAPLPPLGSE